MDADRMDIDLLPVVRLRARPAYSHERASNAPSNSRNGDGVNTAKRNSSDFNVSLFSTDSNFIHDHGFSNVGRLRSEPQCTAEATCSQDTATICPCLHTKGDVREAVFTPSSSSTTDLTPPCDIPNSPSRPPRLTPEEQVALSALPLLSQEQYKPDIGLFREQYGHSSTSLRERFKLARHVGQVSRDCPGACANENNNTGGDPSTSIVQDLCRLRQIPSAVPIPSSSSKKRSPRQSHGYSPYPVRSNNKGGSTFGSSFDLSSAHNLLSAVSFTTSHPDWLDMTSTIDTPRTPTISKTPATPGSSGGSSRINSPGMSLARKRRAPAWPSPRTDIPARDLSTLYTPAALKVPPTAEISPAFRRSGYAAPPRLKSPGMVSASAPLPSAAKLPRPGMIPTGRVKMSGIPQDYVVTQLNALAEKFWFDPGSADCSILVPVPGKAPVPSIPPDSATSVHSNQPVPSYWPPTPVAPDLQDSIAASGAVGSGENVISGHRVMRRRRGSLPDDQAVPVLVFPLHKDYLITQSSLFRSLLSASPLAHLNLPSSPRRNSSHSRTQSLVDPRGAMTGGLSGGAGQFASNQQAILARKGAKVLPQKQGQAATIFVPIPDPGSFGVIVHWLYWGNVAALESALSKGLVTWQGVVKNIEYLGLDDNVKKVMGKWWRKWVKTEGGRRVSEGDAQSRKARTGWKRKNASGGGLAEWEDGSDDDAEGESDVERDISPLPGRAIDPGTDEVSGLLKAL